MDQRKTRSTDMRRDMALGRGSVLPVIRIDFLLKFMGGI
jgi:hypothetical protein